tara:strand:- start:3223 stop:4440 length:1218 start_codon:yes stop_codon:yes gene_type:complete
MTEEVKNQLDQIGNLVDEKIEKAFNAAQDNAKGEVESSLKSEISNLTNDYNEKFEAATKRMDAIEMESKKTLSGATVKTFKGALESALKDGAIEAMIKGNSHAARFELKSSDMTMANTFTGVVAGETVIPDIKFDPSRAVHIRSLIPNGTTDAQTIRFPKESAYTDNAAATAQGSTLGQSDFDITATSVNVEKIGTFMRITEEMLADTPQLTSYLSARVPSKVLSKEDEEILSGDGSSPNLSGLRTDGTAFTTSSGGQFYQAIESANEYDVLIVALNQLALLNYQADSIIVNPTDFHKIVLLKSTANEYLKNQVIQGIQPAINGVPITLNTAMPAGKFLVGNLAQATQLWIRDGLGVEFSREDSTNFRDGFVTVRAQERAALTTYQPNAIVQGTFSTAKTALETS